MSITMNIESPKPLVCDEGSTMTEVVRWAEWLRDFEIFPAGSGLVDGSQNVESFNILQVRVLEKFTTLKLKPPINMLIL